MADERKLPAKNGTDEPERRLLDVRSASLTILAVLAVILVLQLAESVLIPVVLGVLISYALSPIVGSLVRLHIPRAIAAGVAVALLTSGAGLAAYTLSDETMAIVASVPEAAKRIRERVVAHRNLRGGAFEQVQQAAKEIERTADFATKPDEELRLRAGGIQRVQIVEPAFRASDYIWMGGVGLVGFIGQSVMILFLVYFLLVTGDLYKRKLVKIAGPELSHKRNTVQILEGISRQIESFIKVQVLLSFLVAGVTALVLWAFGVQNFVVWGLFAGLFNSIPYLGPAVVSGGLGIVAFLQFDDLLKSTYIALAALAVTGLEGVFLLPTFMSRAAQMNPVAIFVGLLFWTWVWGAWGTVLAVPMLMMVKAVCDNVEDLKPVGELLGE